MVHKIHYVAVDPTNDVVVAKAIVEQFIKKFLYVFQKRPSIKCGAQSFSIFPLEKFYLIPIFVWVLNAWRVCLTTLKGLLWYLAINCQLYHYVIILIDIQRLGISMSFSTNELENFWNFFFFLFWTMFAIFGEKIHQMSNNTKLKKKRKKAKPPKLLYFIHWMQFY